MRIVLVHDATASDGRPDEQDALVQVECIERVLREQEHSTRRVPLGLDLGEVSRRIRESEAELAFNLVESVEGQGRLIHLAPALFDAMRLPYTGVRTEGMFLCSQKVWTKRVFEADGLPTPGWLEESGGGGGNLALPGRYILKSVWEDASLGLDDESVIDASTRGDLAAALLDARETLGGEAFAERWIEGREFNLSLLETEGGPRVLPVAEIQFADFPPGKPRLVGYRAKWDPRSFEYAHTVRRFVETGEDESLVAELGGIARRCWELFGLRGYARVDFRVDADGRPWVLEVNPNPCLSPDAGFVAAAERAGLEFADLVSTIVRSAHPEPQGTR